MVNMAMGPAFDELIEELHIARVAAVMTGAWKALAVAFEATAVARATQAAHLFHAALREEGDCPEHYPASCTCLRSPDLEPSDREIYG